MAESSCWNFKDDFWYNVTFVYRNKEANEVCVVGDFNGWNPSSQWRMQRNDEGYCLTVPLSEGYYHYKFLVDDCYVRDEHNPHVGGITGNSIMFVHMDPGVYGIRNQDPPHREYQRPYGDGSQFRVVKPKLPPDVASWGLLERLVFVYLPPSYQTDSSRTYPVLYACDGQNLFSTPAHAGGPAWGGWYLDAKLDHWWNEGEIPEFILVGIPNIDYVCIGNRQREYAPTDFFNLDKEPFVRYLTQVVKPAIDKQFRTRSEAKHTFILGSSLGGLLAFVLPLSCPDVFSAGVSLSPSFWYVDVNGHSAYSVVQQQSSKNCHLYIDSGDGEGDNKEVVRDMASTLRDCSWREGVDFLYNLDQCKDHVPEGVTHSEVAWRERVIRGLKFVLLVDNKNASSK